MDGVDDRAQRLMEHVMKTWSPPLHTRELRAADIVQTATMLTIAYIFGSEFLPKMTRNQEAAIYTGLALLHRELEENWVPSFSEWMDRWEEAVRDGRSTISREEAERRYYATYGRERDSRGEG